MTADDALGVRTDGLSDDGLRSRRLRPIVEVALGQLPDGGQCRGGLRSCGRDLDLVTLGGAEHRDGVQAGGVRRAPAVGQVADRDPGVERRRGLDETRGRSSVQPVRRGHRQPDRHLVAGRCIRRARIRDGSVVAQVRDLAGEPTARLLRHTIERRAQLRRDGCRHRTLDDRRFTQQHQGPAILGQQVQGELCGQDRAAQVHQHQHTVVGPRTLDRVHHHHGVGADRVLGHVQSPGGLEPDLRSTHLARELRHTLGDEVAVRDDHDAHHRSTPVRTSRPARRSTSRRT